MNIGYNKDSVCAIERSAIWYISFVGLSCLFFCSCSETSEFEECTISPKFRQASGTGISFSNNLTSTTDLNILNYLYFYNGAGVAVGDFNNDDLEDIYFVSNQQADALYMNEGNLKFVNNTASAQIDNSKGWTTGITTVDINNDGWLDIYISKVSGHLYLEGSNLLYVNQGIGTDGYPTFTEEAKNYGLDIKGFSSQASFFDYDLDGDLDAFILRHSLFPNANYGSGNSRKVRDTLSGDLFLENIDGTYVDVSDRANIFSSRIGYGLGMSTGDMNDDGYPDIYIGNDFFENDYLYINQKDGTFKDLNTVEGVLGHTSHFSMGNAIEDINNDARPDIISVDMLPENIETFKASGQEYNYAIFQNQLRNGYEPQFMQNTLHLNLGLNRYTETAFASGIAATEWSWSPLVADFDNDGLKDLYVTNGILGASNDMDFVSFIAEGKIQKQLGSHMDEKALKFIKKLPEKKTPNYIFKNMGAARFEDMKGDWVEQKPSFSNGATYADLDNDGDLDIVVNTINEKSFILENTTDRDTLVTHYLNIKFEGPTQNTLGIGAKVHSYSKGNHQYFQNFTTTGYLSAKAPAIFIGLGQHKSIDSLKVVWPDLSYQVLENIPADQTLVLKFDESQPAVSASRQNLQENIILKNEAVSLEYSHKDSPSIEFSRDPLIPYASTNLGPKLTVGDLNGDALDDMITLGGKTQETTLQFQQADGSFLKQVLPDAAATAINEDIHSVIFDANSDGKNDIIIVSGGNEFTQGKPLQPRLYLASQNGFVRSEAAFKNITVNASTVTVVDIDQDSDQDVVITSNVQPRAFGKTPSQYIFQNDGQGNFKEITAAFAAEFQYAGNIYDINWKDLNNDTYPDAIVAGHWMPITIFMNTGSTLKPLSSKGLERSNGWWNSLEVADFDNDGDFDIVAGNWGLNTRLQPSETRPVRLYRDDFDTNGQIDPVVTYFYDGRETTIATKDEMVKQLPFLNKKFLSYTAFAKADIEQLLGKESLKQADKKEAYTLASTYFENKGDNTFERHTLPFLAQTSAVQDIRVEDFDNDGYLDVLLVGNIYEISTQLGRLDGSHGVLLINDQQGAFRVRTDQPFDIPGASRSIEKLKIKQRAYYIISRTSDTPIFLTTAD